MKESIVILLSELKRKSLKSHVLIKLRNFIE